MIDITLSQVGNTTLIEVKGHIDSMNADRLRQALHTEFASQRKNIVVDMAGVTYFSAAGLRVLRDLYEYTGEVRITRPSTRVREIFQMTGLDAVYKTYDNQGEALS